MRHNLLGLLIILLLPLTACHNEKKTQTPLTFGTELYDSAALHIALVPNRDCLPIYYAQKAGIYDSLGLKLQIASFHSQADCDTALLGTPCDGGYADLLRLKHYGKRANDLKAEWNGTNRWAIFCSGLLRIKDVATLDKRTIAIARNSAELQYLTDALGEANLKYTDVYRPQINDLELRTKMLNGNQVDAAIVCWPYTSTAKAFGHKLLAIQKKNDPNNCFVMKKSRMTQSKIKQQWDLFEKGRKMAQDSLRIKGPKAYSLILQQYYGIPKAIADTIQYK